MTITVLLFLVGLFLIIKGGDVFVDRAVWIAEVFNIPKFIIGATIVSIATTLPEILVSTIATFSGNNSIAMGNAVGSVTANTAMIMAISIIFLSSTIETKNFKFGMICLISSAFILMMICKNGTVSALGSLLAFGVVIIFTWNNLSSSKQNSVLKTSNGNVILPAIPIIKPTKKQVFINSSLFVLSAAAITVGAKLLVESGTDIAKALGVSERVIGLTIIAIGTSLPELVTTITAIAKKHSSLSIGNIIGANIIDLSLIIPICSFISTGKFGVPLPFEPQYEMLDIPICLGFILIACLPPLLKKKFYKFQGVALLVLYFLYIGFSVL